MDANKNVSVFETIIRVLGNPNLALALTLALTLTLTLTLTQCPSQFLDK